ncbi:ring-cleaving dioxygenase [Bacillus licheniformis]|jgi:glyoxalase family protein|uniref:Glyoxalase domain protein YdfO n=5 Tax=Bacillus licheniformis TaxID=1402 RepID=Q65J49_BACLD|nr:MULTISPECIES: ring-cleaving dioxygenase [Bacillus]MBJ7886615.1 ring-cleaving dioxygenase [Bacillaceae bacterium HSR45]MDP4079299.1 ring-cleaving dioxygenase [Bacillota bacterium]AAU23553.1 Glyoxalase domain protein YdfO [Bacillus licheniformis DSM 13 = ATCC 14580]AAU40915.1 putative ring-cleaving dioxygenase MhqO [Bacillus licheniformis DSM 13 = ATCC 14580]AKQ73184.1 glyoxalase [Bacillus licheniformis WX-02]
MKKKTSGIHHITAIVGHPQENVDFYAGVLGLRLVKKTVNFDDPGTYHLYFGNEGGKPGTIITFFPWVGARRGVIGDGQVGVTSYVVPKGAMAFWENRLAKFNLPYTKMNRFGEEYLEFDDPHGLHLEIVEREEGEKNSWKIGEITPDKAIKGFGGATLLSKQPEKTAELLEKVMGLEKVGEEGDFVRFRSSGDIGNIIDLKLTTIGSGQMGIGTVHHIAWRAIDDNDQLEWQKYVAENGYRVTPVQDRNYFNAIYFREHGEILFEIATDPPGFAHDESHQTMGEQLMLPAQYEHYREQLERRLIPITVKALD